MGDLPTRGSSLTTNSAYTCAVPSQFKAYLITEAEITPLTVVGPYLASLTAKAHLSASGMTSDSILSQNSVSAGFQDFLVKHRYCCVKKLEEGAKPVASGCSWMSNFANDKSARIYRSDLLAVYPGCPFKRRPHWRHADDNMRFLAVTVKFNRIEGNGIEDWANFHGVVPVSSMPSWIKIPHGDNRWRLWDESFEMAKDTDGKRILSVTRVLLGIPSGFKDMEGNRCQWNDDAIGQKNWGDLL